VRDSQITWKHLAATCSIPLCFPPVEIDGRRYVDGGLLGALPLASAEEMGATRAIAVNCLTTLPFRLLKKVIPPRRPSTRLEVIRIEPSEPLGSLKAAAFWSEKNVARWMEMGERDAEGALGSI
jgi:predicted acylesterase/phospholipase RssA